MNTNTDISIPMTVGQIARAYATAKDKMVEGCLLLDAAEKELELAFRSGGYQHNGFNFANCIRYHMADFDKPDEFEIRMRQDTWRAIIGLLGIKKISSLKMCKEIDQMLEDLKALPPITEEVMLGMLKMQAENMGETLKGLVCEVFEWLRPNPHGHYVKEYKTSESNQWSIQRRVLIPYAVERQYNGKGYRVSHGRSEDQLRSINTVMLILDGKPLAPTHNGHLTDAIYASGGWGETDYFTFKCYKNRNLHLWFKREDLLAELNRIGSGGEPQLKYTK
jgi:hypothetical protein